MILESKTGDSFEDTQVFFGKRIRKTARSRKTHNAIRIVMGGLTVALLGLAPILGLGTLAMASVFSVVVAQANESFKQKRQQEELLRAVPLDSPENFMRYLKNQTTAPVVERRLNTIAKAYRTSVSSSLITAAAATAAAILTLMSGGIVVPILSCIAGAGEATVAYLDGKLLKSFTAERARSGARMDELVELANYKDIELKLGETITVAEGLESVGPSRELTAGGPLGTEKRDAVQGEEKQRAADRLTKAQKITIQVANLPEVDVALRAAGISTSTGTEDFSTPQRGRRPK